MSFNERYYSGGKMYQLKPKAAAFSTYVTPDNIVIGIFQGRRGGNPLLDFKLRILLDGDNQSPILPPHTYWVVDLMLKCVKYKKEVQEILDFYLNFYETCDPFKTQIERVNYELKTLDYIKKRFSHLEDKDTPSLDYIVILIELFCLNEKQTPDAYMFKNLLNKLSKYASGASNYIELLEAAKPGNR